MIDCTSLIASSKYALFSSPSPIYQPLRVPRLLERFHPDRNENSYRCSKLSMKHASNARCWLTLRLLNTTARIIRGVEEVLLFLRVFLDIPRNNHIQLYQQATTSIANGCPLVFACSVSLKACMFSKVTKVRSSRVSKHKQIQTTLQFRTFCILV